MAPVVGFLPSLRPFYLLAAALIVAAAAGFIVRASTGGEMARFMAAGAL